MTYILKCICETASESYFLKSVSLFTLSNQLAFHSSPLGSCLWHFIAKIVKFGSLLNRAHLLWSDRCKMFSETKPYSTSLKSLSICQLISLFVPGGDSDLCMSLWNDTPHLSSIFARHLFWEMKKNMIFRFFLLGSFQFAVIYVSHWVMTFWIQRWKWKWIWILFWVQAFFFLFCFHSFV